MDGRRGYVPSPREAEAGAVAEAAVPGAGAAPAEPAPERGSLRDAAAGLVRDLEPRRVAGGGPLTPLLVLSLLPLLSQWDDAAFTILLPEMRTDFGFDLTFLLTLQVMMLVVQQLGAPVTGYLADRLRRVNLVRIGAFVANIASILTGLARGAPLLVGGRVAAGAGAAISAPAGFPLLTDYYPSRTRARVFAFVSVAGYLGAVLGPVIGGNLGEAFGWRTAMVSLGVLALAVSFLTFLLREPVRGYLDRVEQGVDHEAAQVEQPPVSWTEGWRAARSITTVRRLWYATPFLEAAGQSVLLLLSVYYAEVFGLGPRTRGYIFMGAAIASLCGLLLSGPVGDRVLAHRPERFMTLLGVLLVLQAASIAVLAVSPWPWLSVVVTLPTGFIGSLFAPALYALLSLAVPARIRGLGLQTIAPWRVAGLLLVIVAGAIGESVGLRSLLLILVPMYLVGAAILGTSARGVAADIRTAKAAALATGAAQRAREAGRSALLVCRDVQAHYGGAQVLFGIDLDVGEGEIVALLGTNGAGKSTLLRAIAGVHEASGGAILFDGTDVTHAPPDRNAASGIVMVPGGRGVFADLTVAENLRTAAWLRRDDQSGIRESLEEVFGLFPVLRQRQHALAGNLSGGEQQMLALAQAFLLRPRLLMIDELTLGLAPQVVSELLDVLRSIHERGTTIVLVEQSVNVALRAAERAVFLEKGQVRFDGATDELTRRPDLVRSVFLGGAAAAAGTAPRRRGPDEEREAVLRAEGVGVAFGGVTALRDVSVGVEAGEVVGVIGPNGAGKTTLFDVLSGFVRPDAGRVFIGAADVTGDRPDARARAGLGRSFQNARLFGALTVRENIAVALHVQAEGEHPLLSAVWHPRARRLERRLGRRTDELVGLLGLEAWADASASELSIGVRRTLEIACQMAASPSVLLLDEPSSGLAQAETDELGAVLRGLVRDTGCALLVIEHDLPLVVRIADRLVAMDLGRVVTSGAPGEVVEHPEVVRSYLAGAET